MTSEFIESEMQPPATQFEERKYRVSYRCSDCGHTWKSGWRRSVPKKDPPCPNTHCAEMRAARQMAIENANLKRMLAEQQPPAQIGNKMIVKAVDATAEITMQDYGLTDLKDNIRPGENMVPKLPPQQQAMADSYFTAGTSAPKGESKMVDFATGRMRPVQARHLEAIGKRALAGGYRRLAVNPTAVIPENVRNKPPIMRTRSIGNDAYVKKS